MSSRSRRTSLEDEEIKRLLPGSGDRAKRPHRALPLPLLSRPESQGKAKTTRARAPRERDTELVRAAGTGYGLVSSCSDVDRIISSLYSISLVLLHLLLSGEVAISLSSIAARS
jgi:hypothetical protein